MIFALLAFLALGFVVAVTPGAVLGCVFVGLSGKLPRAARVTLLLVLAAGPAAMWLVVMEIAVIWRLAGGVLSFTATIVSGVAFLAREAHRRRALQFPTAVWPGWSPPGGGM
ncbi:hypothetical protein [Streptomyces sirii]|uniref:hypothetical protein n=1 Tax=Streptomyces sirii TaxID=3127701 RepID=UPI003D366827